jgi:hypothetical protein
MSDLSMRWESVSVWVRQPTVVPIVYCEDGKWGVAHMLTRCLSECRLAFPLPDEADEGE